MLLTVVFLPQLAYFKAKPLTKKQPPKKSCYLPEPFSSFELFHPFYRLWPSDPYLKSIYTKIIALSFVLPPHPVKSEDVLKLSLFDRGNGCNIFSLFPLVVLKMAMLIKGTAVDTLWPAGGKRGNEGENQIDCVSTNAAGKGKKKPLEGPCNLRSKINDVPML